ncbi:hypothetical protein JCGZ_17119 [Jatropha curcas]|uniref:Uncharacterized protein n=1 Tax=Jatropha curcas TaxID=180498 RepID=A0A067KDQ6_JATCU|nr:hypothetical protein JCGZ_17119 [Jatropha curcas]
MLEVETIVVEYIKLKTANKEQVIKIKSLKSQVQQLEIELKEAQDQDEMVKATLAHMCLNLRTKVITKLNVQDPDKDWDFIQGICHDDDKETKEVEDQEVMGTQEEMEEGSSQDTFLEDHHVTEPDLTTKQADQNPLET